MRKGLLLLVILCTAFIRVSTAAEMDHLLQQQNQFSNQIVKIQASTGEEALFLEDVLRRKNGVLRESVSNLVTKNPETEGLKKLIPAQASMLEALIVHADKQAEKLFQDARTASGAEKAEFQFLAQQRVSTVDIYYTELATTFKWAKTLNLKLDDSGFKQDLQKRSQVLYDIVIYLDSRKKALDERMTYTTEADKPDLETQVVALAQLQRFLLASMNNTVALMSDFGLDVTEYKQTLFAMTGDINADVLDVNVAVGLFSEWLDSFKDWAFDNSPSLLVKLLVFLAVLWVTRILSKIIANLVKRSVSHSKMDFSVLMQDFFTSIVSKAVTFIGLLIALSQVGINLGPLLTGFGVAGVIIGFALQDTLSNFASGLMILIYRPFDVKDLVQVAGIQGTVSHMSLVSTTIRTLDNQTLVIPNNKIWGDVINNMTSERVRRVDMVFGIGYADDFDFAKKIAIQVLENHDRVLKHPELNVRVHTLNESSVDLIVRPWVRTDDYWDVYWDVTEEMKRQFDANGITIPFPQRDVHIYKTEQA
ncbi:mechanosensitive ion channel protein [Vibrio sp. UCD-FRSSP16_10]|uniref:mechanosensitive ion channel family protein n=1 Tax=unclassified Vibrio TaxID=2614977 RepID=UPI0008000F4E|nr:MULTISPECIES: mechanosensitive ion channel family protein [unclassified Vibrio]OBT16968.1 mechanosensitive ion channel protein [Vibrio sp. UCD-FRSSP16_30]OBT21959.1 mechanosensitive ion channel protein [Vibrio sp. UCD-FRSSP16_10]